MCCVLPFFPSARQCLLSTSIVCLLGVATNARSYGQVTQRRIVSATPTPTATLQEQLINRMRAVREDQKAFIRFIDRLVKDGRLDPRLVVAIERYALKRNRALPFPYFERAIRFEARRRGIAVPSVRQFATTRVVVTDR